MIFDIPAEIDCSCLGCFDPKSALWKQKFKIVSLLYRKSNLYLFFPWKHQKITLISLLHWWPNVQKQKKKTKSFILLGPYIFALWVSERVYFNLLNNNHEFTQFWCLKKCHLNVNNDSALHVPSKKKLKEKINRPKCIYNPITAIGVFGNVYLSAQQRITLPTQIFSYDQSSLVCHIWSKHFRFAFIVHLWSVTHTWPERILRSKSSK